MLSKGKEERRRLTDIFDRQLVARPTSSPLKLDHHIWYGDLCVLVSIEAREEERHLTKTRPEGFGVHAVVREREGFDCTRHNEQ
jgi:hypothetical protein